MKKRDITAAPIQGPDARLEQVAAAVGLTTRRIAASRVAGIEPEFIRLPKAGALCPYSGLSRSFLNSLVLPGPQNDYRPPVRSIPLRKRGAQKGVRVIVWSSLKAWIYAQEAPAQRNSVEPDGARPPNC